MLPFGYGVARQGSNSNAYVYKLTGRYNQDSMLSFICCLFLSHPGRYQSCELVYHQLVTQMNTWVRNWVRKRPVLDNWKVASWSTRSKWTLRKCGSHRTYYYTKQGTANFYGIYCDILVNCCCDLIILSQSGKEISLNIEPLLILLLTGQCCVLIIQGLTTP